MEGEQDLVNAIVWRGVTEVREHAERWLLTTTFTSETDHGRQLR
jgi:hypothetical protein